MGPLISKAQHDKVVGLHRRRPQEGADLRQRRRRALAAGFRRRLLRRADDLHRRAPTACGSRGEEIFGPVMSVLSFDDEDVGSGPRQRYASLGLAAGVFTRDLPRAHRVIAEVQAGHLLDQRLLFNLTPVEIPFGGWVYKQLHKVSAAWRTRPDALRHYAFSGEVGIYVETGDVASPVLECSQRSPPPGRRGRGGSQIHRRMAGFVRGRPRRFLAPPSCSPRLGHRHWHQQLSRPAFKRSKSGV